MKQSIVLKPIKLKFMAPRTGLGSISSLACLAAFFLFPIFPVAAQDSPVEACEEAVRILRSDGDINEALEEARWCVEGLEALKQETVLDFFPDEVGSWVAGKVSNNQILGMTMIERDYSRDGQSINVSLANGGSGMGLMALAQMGMQLGGEVLSKFRVDRRTVLDISDADEVQFLIQLRSGGIINVTSQNVDADAVKAFVTEFPVGKLDESLEE